MKEIMDFLKEEGISPKLIQEVQEFSAAHPVKEELNGRIPVPHFYYYGKKVWEEAWQHFCVERIYCFQVKKPREKCTCGKSGSSFRPSCLGYLISCQYGCVFAYRHGYFQKRKVEFRPGPVYSCACNGGFGIFDEINMARNEALAVLHSALDFRRVIDVPGYERITLADDTRFIATMNYNYAGTRELNEALASRFVVIRMPALTLEDLQRLLREQFPDLSSKYNKQFGLLFMDIQKKCESGELTSKAMDLRGLLDAISLMHKGIPVRDALDLGVTNKIFDSYEQALLSDVMNARISMKLKASEVFDG